MGNDTSMIFESNCALHNLVWTGNAKYLRKELEVMETILSKTRYEKIPHLKGMSLYHTFVLAFVVFKYYNFLEIFNVLKDYQHIINYDKSNNNLGHYCVFYTRKNNTDAKLKYAQIVFEVLNSCGRIYKYVDNFDRNIVMNGYGCIETFDCKDLSPLEFAKDLKYSWKHDNLINGCEVVNLLSNLEMKQNVISDDEY